MVFQPPGSAKSTYGSVRFPTWYLGNFPKHDIIQACNTADLAMKFGRRTRNLIDSKRYRTIFDVGLARDMQSKGQWEVIELEDPEAPGGEYFAVGVEGTVTGRRGDGGLIDDPVRSKQDAGSQLVRDKQWEWYLTDFCTRIKPNGWKIIIQTRWHEDDLSGRILPDEWNGETGWVEGNDGEEWYVLCLPAEALENDPLGRKPGEFLWEEYLGPTYRTAKKRQTNPKNGQVLRDWYALYQQNPTPSEGVYFRRDTLLRYVPGDQPEHLHRYGTSDFAVTEAQEADYTVFGDWGVDKNGEWWLLDGYREQSTSSDWVGVLAGEEEPRKKGWFSTKGFLRFFGEKGVIKNAVEPFLKQRMRAMGAFTSLYWMGRPRDKQAMAQAFRGMCELGMIHIPLTEFGESVVKELLEFPAGKHDDCVDMCALVGLAVDQGVLADEPEPEEEEDADGYVGMESMDSDSFKVN